MQSFKEGFTAAKSELRLNLRYKLHKTTRNFMTVQSRINSWRYLLGQVQINSQTPTLWIIERFLQDKWIHLCHFCVNYLWKFLWKELRIVQSSMSPSCHHYCMHNKCKTWKIYSVFNNSCIIYNTSHPMVK